MLKLLILGAGTGGSTVANVLASKLDEHEAQITVIDRTDTHYYQPGFLFIPFKLYGFVDENDVTKPVSDILSKSIEFVQAEITRIDPKGNTVQTSEGDFEYDWLICALGCHVAADEIDGCAEAMGKDVHTFYTLPGALAMQQALSNMDHGKLVIDIAESPIKCPVAPIESAFLADYCFSERGMRDKVDITLVTPYAGAFTKPNANKVLTKLAEQKNINIVSDFQLESVDSDNKQLVAYGGKTVDYDLACIIAPTLGPDVILKSGLSNDMGYGITDPRTLKSKKADNVYFIVDNTDVPTSKAGSVSHFEAETVVTNLLREIKGDEPLPSYDGHSNCYIESGYHKALLVDFNYDVEPLQGVFPLPYVGPFTLLEESYVNHLGKIAFKWVYWNLVVSGRAPDIPFVPAHMSLVGKDLAGAPPLREATSLTVAELMTGNVFTTTTGTPVKAVARLLKEHAVSGLPVTGEQGNLAGIITTSDIINSLDINEETAAAKILATLIKHGRDKKLGSIVDDLMTTKLITIAPGESILAAVELMNKNNINRLIVSEDGHTIVGILARSDILKVFH